MMRNLQVVPFDQKLKAMPIHSTTKVEVSDLPFVELYALAARVLNMEINLRYKDGIEEIGKCTVNFILRLKDELAKNTFYTIAVDKCKIQLRSDLRKQVRNLVTAYHNLLITYKAVPTRENLFILLSTEVIVKLEQNFKMMLARAATRELNDAGLINERNADKKLKQLQENIRKREAADLNKGLASSASQAETNRMVEAVRDEKQVARILPRELTVGSLPYLCHSGDLDGVKQYFKQHSSKLLTLHKSSGTDFLQLYEDPNHPSIVDEYMTPFHISCLQGHDHIVKYLFEKKYADPMRLSQVEKDGKRHNAWNALHLAVRSGNAILVEYLCTKGLNVNAKGEYGITPLHLATFHQHFDVVNCLLKHNALVNLQTDNYSTTPLHNAVTRDDSDIIALLLEQPACLVQMADSNKMTPLQLAVELCHESAIVEFLRKGHCLPEQLLKKLRDDYKEKKLPDEHPFMSYQLALMTYVTQSFDENYYKPLAIDDEEHISNDDDDDINNNDDEDSSIEGDSVKLVSRQVENVEQDARTLSVHSLEM